MIYLILLFYPLLCGTSLAQEAPVSSKIGALTILRGSNSYIYAGSDKKIIKESSVPYYIYSGDEVQTPYNSHCEIVLDSGSTIYVGPETLLSISKKGGDLESIFLKYGLTMFRGVRPVDFRVSDVYIKTISGDFIARYKKTDFELTFLNLGSDVYVKQTNDDLPLKVQKNKYIKAISFKDQKYWGDIKQETIPKLYDSFKTPFKPEGPAGSDDIVSSSSSDTKKDIEFKSVNVDKVKRATGL